MISVWKSESQQQADENILMLSNIVVGSSDWVQILVALESWIWQIFLIFSIRDSSCLQ